MVTQERLKELYNYCPETGVFTRKTSRKGNPAGSVAGNLNQGYLRFRVDGKTYKAHRMAWLYVYGVMPKNDIDHINQIKTDNRIANLRDVTDSENQMNKGPPSSNKTGYKGVSYCKQSRLYMANCQRKGRTYYAGLFDTAEEANIAAIALRKEIHGEFATS